MRYIFLSTIIFLFHFVSCDQPSKIQQKDNFSNNSYPDNSRPKQAITYEELSEMMDSYNTGAKSELDNYMKKISNGKDSISTVYNWYKIEDLKQYIAYVKRITKEKKIPVTGFRIYPTSYPINYYDEKLMGRQTLIFTPTTTINGKNDVAFEPLYSEIGKPVIVSEFLEKVKKKKSNLAKSINTTSIQSSSANRLEPSPPF